jgi:hypothetical protein
MSDFETSKFGNRCPNGYFKEAMLGKGGYAIVWKLLNLKTGEYSAGKQFPKVKGCDADTSADNEI